MAKRVTAKEAAELMAAGWTYLDVRSVPEFDAGHPQGALNVPLMNFEGGRMTPNPDFQKVMETAFPRDTKLVIGCKSGGRSLQAAALLASAGYGEVVDVRGGFGGERDPLGRVTSPGWADSGLPVAAKAAPGCSYAEIAARSAKAGS